MKLVLREGRSRRSGEEHSFEQPVVRVGRDRSTCRLTFDGARWPMVSRRHAEFRLENGRCLLVDTGSTQGTYLDGRRVRAPIEVRVGSVVQFGAEGPVIRIVGLECAAPAIAPGSVPLAGLELVTAAPGPALRFELAKEVTCLGRDKRMDVCFDAADSGISRQHAEIRRSAGRFQVRDLGSMNGTLVNDRRIAGPTPLAHGDRIQLGKDGPVFRFVLEDAPASADAAEGLASPGKDAEVERMAPSGPKQTVLVHGVQAPPRQRIGLAGGESRQAGVQHPFAARPYLSVGRAPDNDIVLEPLQISKHHARFHRVGERIEVEDRHSTNGVFIDGQRVQGRKAVPVGALVQIGPFVLQADPRAGISVLDSRANARLDVLDLSYDVRNRSGGGMLRLLHGIKLAIQPNEFVGLLGPSGAGKSLLMNAVNGMSPPTAGRVLLNGLDLYQHLDALKQSIGYVPQDDIIHRELTVYRTLYYVARLRLSHDISARDLAAIVHESMEVTGLTERRNVPVHQLSGGQRKRVSIAVELITKPPVIFLDEPTSGLDPATEDKIMTLFREIADAGRTVVLTTHAMENVRLFDKLVVLLRGRLVFFGPPQEALEFVGAESFKELYDKLEAPVAASPAGGEPKRDAAPALAASPEQIAEEWKRRFEGTELHRRLVKRPAEEARRGQRAAKQPRTRAPSVSDQVHQWTTLVARYLAVLAGDRNNLLLLFGMAPLVALATYLPVRADKPPVFLYFVMAFAPLFFGIYAAIREVIRERAVFDRERMVNLGIVPYVASKISVLSLIVALQCTFFFFTLDLLGTEEKMNMPGVLGGVPELGVMILTGMVGIVMGLFVSALVKTSEMAQTLLTLVVVPQLALSGLLGKLEGAALFIGSLLPVTWGFDELKRNSQFLRPGTHPQPYGSVGNPIGSEIAFHPWGDGISNSLVLLLMFLFWSAATVRLLRNQKVRTRG